MANKKIQATATLFLNTADAKKDAEKFVNDIKQKLKSIETAADKVDVFKDLVGYISQVDKALSALKSNNKDVFNSMFNGIDSNLLKEIEGIFGTTKEQLVQLDQLRTKILNAKNNGATTDELKELEQQIKGLYAAAGKMDDLKLSGRGALETRLKNMESALDNFATVWDEVNKRVQQGFNVQGGPGGDGGISKLTDAAQQEINKLENKIANIKDLLRELDDVFKNAKNYSSGKDVTLEYDLTEESAHQLINTLRELSSVRQKFDTGSLTTEKDYQDLIKYTKAATQLLALDTEMSDNGNRPKFLKEAMLGEFDSLFDFVESINKKFVNTISGALNKVVLDAQSKIDAIKSDTSNYIKVAGGSSGGSGSGDGSGGKITNIDFTSLESTIKSEISSLASKLDSTLKVEVVKNDTKNIQSAIDGIKASIEKISSAIDQYNASLRTDPKQLAVENMKSNLMQLLDITNKHNAGRTANGQYQRQELSASLLSDGSFSINYGERGSVPWDQVAEQLVANLTKSLIGDIHTHPIHELFDFVDAETRNYVSDMFSGSSGDLGAFSFSKELGAQIAGMLTGNVLRVLDLSKLTPDNMKVMRKNLKAIEDRYVASGKYDNYIGKNQDGSMYYKTQKTLEGQHQVTKIFESMMYEAFAGIGFSKDQVDAEIFKKYNLTDDKQLTDLANRLVDLAASASKALSPVDRLTDIILQFGGDALSKKADVLFEAYNKGEVSAADVFNELVPDHSVDQDAMNSLLSINAANQLSPVETLLSNISSILTTISSSINSIELNTSKNTSEQLSSSINDIVSLKYGNTNGGLTNGVQSIYDPNNITKYKYDDVVSSAQKAVNDFITHLAQQELGLPIAENDFQAAQLLMSEFKTAFTYVEDVGKQLKTYVEESRDGTYRDPDTNDVLGDYDSLKQSLLDSRNVLEPLLNMLSAAKTSLDTSRAKYGPSNDDINQTSAYAYIDNTDSISSEVQQLHQLQNALDNISVAIDQKTRGFINEEAVVSGAVDTEVSALRQLYEELMQIVNVTDVINTNFAQTSNITANLGTVDTDKIQNSQIDVPDINSQSIDSETASLDSLLAKINEVRIAIDAKTQAFEQEYVTADAAVDAELASLQRLLEKLDAIVTQANIVNSSLDKIGANSVELNVGDSEEQLASLLTSSDITTEISQLEQLQAKVIEVKNAVISKTKAFSDEGAIVGQSVGKEIAALMKLSDIVDDITPKINALIFGLNGIDKKGIDAVKGDGSSAEMDTSDVRTPEEQLKIDKTAQKGSLTKYINSLENVGYASTESRQKLQSLYESIDNISTPEGLEQFKKDLKAVKTEIEIAKDIFENINLGYLNKETSKIKNAFNSLTPEQKLQVQADYEKAYSELERYKLEVKDGKKIELDVINAVTSALMKQMEVYKEINKEAQKSQREVTQNEKFGSTAEINATAKANALKSKAGGTQFANSVVVQEGVAKLEEAYNKILEKRKQFAGQDIISDDDKSDFKQLTKEFNDCASALDKLIKSSEKLSSNRFNETPYMLGDDFTDDANGRRTALNNFIQSMDGVDAATIKFDDNFNKCMFTVKNGDGTFTKMTATFTDARNEIVALAGETKKATGFIGSFWNELKGKFRSIGSYMIASFSFHEVWQVLKQGVNYVREIDSALTELKKVTDETDASYANFLQDMSKTGSVIGATVSNLTTMAAEWSRLGYSMEEAGRLAESTAILLNVSEFEDATTASEALISTMQAFGYVAEDSQRVVDILNEVGNNYAISSDGIATALQDSASALMEAGNTLEQSVALVASANKVVQDPNSVGSALRTISLRLRGTSVKVLEEMGEETDGVVESVSKMQSKIEALTGVNILTDSGAYKETYTILQEIGQVWEDMSDIDQAALLELMAGKNRANTLAAILGNMDDLENAYKDALGAEGSALKENAAYLDSIQGRIDVFNNTLQTMWMNFIDADVVKFIVDLGTGLIKIVDTLGLIPTLLGALGGFKIIKSIFGGDTFKALADSLSGVLDFSYALTAEGQKVSAALISEAAATALANSELVKYAITSGIVTAEQVANMTTTELLGTAFLGLAAKIKTATVTLAKFLFTTPAGWAILAVAAITSVIAAYNEFGPTHENYIEKLEEETEALKSVQNELKSVQSELKTTKDRIDELNAKDNLSFVEQEELDRLERVSAELERQEKILLAQEKRARNKQIDAALKAAGTDHNLNNTTQSAMFATANAYAASSQDASFVGSMPYAAGLQNPNTTLQSDTNKYESALHALKTAKEDLEKAEIELENTTYDAESKEYKKLEKAVEKAQNRVNKYNDTIDSMDEAWQTEYGEIGYVEDATTESEKKWNEYYRQHQDYLYQQALINNDIGKDTVLDNTFSDKGTDIAQEFKTNFESAVKEGNGPTKVIEELLASGNYDSVLNDLKNKFNITTDDIVDYFTKVGEVIKTQYKISPTQTYSELSTSIESYNEVLAQTSEIVSDNTEVSQEYKDSLTAIGISSEELAECFDENNGLIVKNSDKLKDLIKKQKDEYKNNVKTAKSQAKLKYYKLSKDLVNTLKSTKNLTNAQKDHIQTILKEMDAVQDTISKYTMLESELLGVTNAYKKLADAQEIDEATDYGSKAEEMVNTLANAFNTGELGTAAAEAAFEGLIPDWVVANAQSVDEAMESAYNYMKSGALSNLFDIKYDDDGKLESVQMTLDKVKAFTSALTEADTVFHGTWDEFTLDPAIKNLDDFASAIGVTKEVAFAYLTELERYDASNIFGDSATGLLDQLMGDDFDYVMQQASQKYAQAAADMAKEFDQVNEKVNMFNRKILYDDEGYMVTMAAESFNASDFGLDGDFAFNVTPILPDGTKLENVEDYIYDHLASGGKLEDMDIFLGSYATLDEAIAKAKRLSELQGVFYENQLAIEEMENKALDFAGAWAKTSDQLNDAREEAESLGRELAGAKDGVNESTGRTVEEIEADIKKNDQLISDLLSNLSKLKDEFGGEPTEMVVGVALDEVQEDIDNFKKDLEKKPAELRAAITKIDATGFENLGLTKEADGSWSGLAELDWYQNLDPASQAEVTNYLNMVESEHYLNLLMGDGVPTIEEHLQTISTVLQDIAKMMNPTYTLNAETTTATNNVIEFWNWWGSLGDKVITLYQRTIGSWFGDDNVNGNANVGGNAYAGGKWGAKQTEASLVGELGPEMIVRGNRWFTVGENGAEFTQVKKGDIIFNHRQTEELLKNGHVTSRGKAYASGTAYAGIDTFTPYVPPVVSSGGNSDSGNDNDDDYDDDAEDVVDFIEMKLEEIEAIIEKTSAKIANFLDDTTSIKSKDDLYDELVKAEKDKSEAYLKAAQKYNVEAAAALSGVPQQYQEMARNGAIAIEDFIGEDQVEIAEKIQEYRDWAAKADEAENGHLEAIAAISAHRVEQLEDIVTDFENIISITQSHSDLLQAEMDFIEESGGRLSEDYYEELKKHSQRQLDDMQAERVALQKILDDSVAAGDVVIGSDDWYSMLETIYEVDKEIVDCKTSLEEFQNAINELYWDNFEKLIDEIDNVGSELSNLYDLISDDDKVVDEMGNWTDEGVTALGLLAQQMEVAQQKSKEYGKAIDKLKKDYAAGLYSTDEYNEKLAELTESQYDAIKSYEDAKDAIVDLNKTRIEAVKEGIQKEIDAYSELIEKKKESLNSDKEAYDFQKQVEESNKNIEAIERKIASLEGNTSSSAMAQRKRLEAELLKAKEEQQDMYYDHSIEKQQEALDKELEDYTKNKEDEMDALDEYLKKEEQVISDSFDLIAENTRNIANTLIGISEEYGVSISDTVATPWINGTNAIGTYEEQLNTSVSATTKNLETLKQQLEDLQTQADRTANSIVNATHSTIVETNDGHQTSIKGYAKGSKSIEYDQWALIDELGDELQLVPNGSGRLDYIKKGTGILNNTLTEKLMDLAMDPTSVLENSRPVIGAPGITTTNNTITIDNSVGTLLHVEHLDGSNPAEVAKLVDKAWEKKMQTLNNSIKKFTR